MKIAIFPAFSAPHLTSRLRFKLFAAWLVFVFLAAVPALAWSGRDWDEWKKITTWTRPETPSAQAGRKELVPPLATGTKLEDRIETIRDWEVRRAELADTIRKILGEPADLKPPPIWPRAPIPEVRQLSETTQPDHIRRHIRIKSESDDWIPAWLLIPRGIEQGERRPAMICLHQAVAQGKDEPAGIEGDPELAFALQLVRRGFVCIAPDMIGFGERIPPGARPYHDAIAFYQRHPGWSFMGKMIWDISRVVDYLEMLDFVDRLQIGGIGHGHGAYAMLFAAAFEPRVALAVASCGFTTFRADPMPERWSHQSALIPQIGAYLPDTAGIPFDWQHLIALIAPRPAFIWYATEDDIFPNTDNLDGLLTDVRGVYGLYGAAGDLAWKAFDGGHGFPRQGRMLAYEWLEERLFPIGDLGAVPATTAEWERRRELIQKVIRRTLGTPAEPPPPPATKVVVTEQRKPYERRLIEYDVDVGERIRAYVCLPSERGTAPLPGMLVLHQATSNGKFESAGVMGDPAFAFARDLAERGYIALAPDSLAAGERIDQRGPFNTAGHYLKHPDLSAMARMLHDAQAGLNALARVEGVDAGRLGVIGHSLGAEQALMLAAFDPRVKVTVASCGYATFAAEKDRLRWAHDHWFSSMPRLRPVFQIGRTPHWDWDDVLRLIAPRALYQHTARLDEIFPQAMSAYNAGQDARKVWELYEAPADRFQNVLQPGGHTVSPEARADIYKWLDRQLR